MRVVNRMKPGRNVRAGLIGIMMVLPSSVWKQELAQAPEARVVVREAPRESAELPPAATGRHVRAKPSTMLPPETESPEVRIEGDD